MKKFFMIALVTLFAGNAMALDNVPVSGPSFSAFGGMTVSNLKNSGMNPKVGATLGAKMDYYLPNAKGTYISAGIDWTHKGAREGGYQTPVTISGSTFNTGVTHKIQAHYFEIPVHVGFRYNLNKKFGFYGEVGPYFAFGFTGKNKWKYDEDMIKDEHVMLFGKHYGQHDYLLPSGAIDNVKAIQRFDCGFGFRVGAEYNNQYSINFGYDWGFTDMYKDDYRAAYQTATGGILMGHKLPKMKNHNLSVTFGYRF